MTTVKIVYTFRPVDKTYVVYKTYTEDTGTTGAWESEAELNTNDEILAFAKTKVDAGIEVELAE